jgi:hypothetical protein
VMTPFSATIDRFVAHGTAMLVPRAAKTGSRLPRRGT